MHAFDAETYLRLLSERLLFERDPQHHRRSPLDLPASALVVAGLIEPDQAARVVEDHTAALMIRSGQRGFPHFESPRRRHAPGRLEPRETMLLNREIAFAEGVLFLRDLSIAASSATLRFRWRSDAGGRSRGHGRLAMAGGTNRFPWGAAAPVILDDQGNRPTVTSGGGSGNDSQWDGKLQLQGALSPTTAWLQIEGEVIDLDRKITPSTTRVEPLPDKDLIERFLWRQLAVAEMPFGHTVELEPALQALIAAGVLTADQPLIAELQQVNAQLPGRHSRRGTQPGTAGNAGSIPGFWRALLARVGRNDGPSWTHVLGAVSEPFDGMQAAIHSISSDQDGFDAEFEVSPNVLHLNALDELPVAWWARDDRGNRHLAHPNGWSGNKESASGTMRFWPALDPRATELQLVVSAEQHQAIFSIPLTPQS